MTPRDAAVIKALIATGGTPEQIVAVVDAMTIPGVRDIVPDVPDTEPHRAYERDRKRAQRAAKSPIVVPDGVPDISPVVPTTTTTEVTTIDDGLPRATADPKNGGLSRDAMALAEEIALLCDVGPPKDWPVHWCGAALSVQAWLNEGVDRRLILAVVKKKLARKRPGLVVFSINYFAHAIAHAFEESRQKPLPLMSLVKSEENDEASRRYHDGRGDGHAADVPRSAAFDAMLAKRLRQKASDGRT